MLMFKLFFLTLCLYTTYGSSESSSEELEDWLSNQLTAGVLQNTIKRQYDENKLNLMAYVIRKQQESDLNVTLIGSQNIYGPDGEVAEIRTVELHISPITGNDDGVNGESDDDDDIYHILSELRKVFDVSTKLGFPLELATEEYNKTGSVINSASISKDLLYAFTEGLNIVNKTLEVNTSKIVDDQIKELQAKGLPVAVHKFDASGQFISEESTIIPQYAVSVVNDDADVDQELLKEAQKGLATIYLKYINHKDEIPSKLAEYLSIKYPQLDFNVFFNEPEAWYLNKDFKINLRLDLDEEDNLKENFYSIFVLKKAENTITTTTAIAE